MAKGQIKVKVCRLAHGEGLPLPEYQTAGAAGLDLVAALDEGEVLVLGPGMRGLVPTGLVIEVPKGFEAQVRPRSGLALKHGVTVLNSPGTIDSDYRGEVKVILINLGSELFHVRRGERIAQLVLAPVVQASLVPVASLTATKRGEGGFGSTLISAKGSKKNSRAAGLRKSGSKRSAKVPRT